MRVLLLGATGLIGSAVAARLQAAGHESVGVARKVDGPARRVPVARWIALDLRDIRAPEDWLPHLAGIDAVVNCAGTLQDNARDSTARVHADAPAALWAACEQAGVLRVVQMSAMGVDRPAATAFMRTKQDGDAALAASGLDWVILRPSVVLGRQATSPERSSIAMADRRSAMRRAATWHAEWPDLKAKTPPNHQVGGVFNGGRGKD